MFPKSGFNGGYHWIEAYATDLESFLRCCHNALLDKYLAVSAVDSGSFRLREPDLAAGWSSNGGIAFGPRIASAEDLTVVENQISRCVGYNELYTFESPPKLGALYTGDVFEATICSNSVVAFVNFKDFRFSAPEAHAITGLFWAQMEWMRPESYIADTPDCLLFATLNEFLFDSAFRHLEEHQGGY